MDKLQKISLFTLRIGMGWLFFYAGITKVLNPEWSSAGYIGNASTFPDLFAWFALPQNLIWVDFLNQWGLTLIGVSLILGLFVRPAVMGGMLLMLLYWLPILDFPMAGEHSYLIDDHIIYIFGLMVLCAFHAGRVWGLDSKLPWKKLT